MYRLFVTEPSNLFPIPLELGETIKPLRLTYRCLADAVTLSHEMILDGLWSVEEAEVYLQYHCIKTKSLELILKHVEHCKEYKDIMGNDPLATAAEKAAIVGEKERHPELYMPWPLPAMWTRGVTLGPVPRCPYLSTFPWSGENCNAAYQGLDGQQTEGESFFQTDGCHVGES